jgi:membrane protein
LANRGSIGLIGIVGLLWAAATLFAYLESSLNVIWDGTRRAAFRRRLIGVLTVLIIGLVFILSIFISALPALRFLGVFDSLLSSINLSLGYGITVLFFWLVYRWLPNAKVLTVPSLVAAIFAGLVWKIAQSVFQWFLTSGLVDYGALYGSLASIIALILWVYLNGYIVLLGAEFGSTLQSEIWGNNSNAEKTDRPEGQEAQGVIQDPE